MISGNAKALFLGTLSATALAAISGCAASSPGENRVSQEAITTRRINEVWVFVTVSSLPNAGTKDMIRLSVPHPGLGGPSNFEPVGGAKDMKDGEAYLLRYVMQPAYDYNYNDASANPDHSLQYNLHLTSQGGDAFYPHSVVVAYKLDGDPNARFVFAGRWRDDFWIAHHHTDPWVIARMQHRRRINESIQPWINGR